MIYFVIAGEFSGDRLGGSLMAALKKLDPKAEFHGVGGHLMTEQGLQSLFPFEQITILGFTAALYHIRRLYRCINRTADAVNRLKPDVVISIDSPDFAIRVRRRITIAARHIHYVAPIVWVGRKKRAREYAQSFDAILTLFPFEPPYFNRHGGNAVFVGHDMFTDPKLIHADGKTIRTQALAKAGLAENRDAQVIALLPGSRRSELKRLLTVFIETAKRIRQHNPHTAFVLSSFEKFTPLIQPHLKNLPILLITDEHKRFDAMKACDLALAASGTVTLHLAMLGIPYIVAYRMGFINWLIWRVWIKKINLFNLITGQDIIKEYIQHHCTAEKLSDGLTALSRPEACQEHLQALKPLIADFRPPEHAKRPEQSYEAARIILGIIRGTANRPKTRPHSPKKSQKSRK